MNKVVATLKHEVKQAIPPAIFFFFAFNLITFTSAMMLEEYGISVSTFATATIGALIVAKVVLIVDMLPIVNRFPHKPLAYNVVWKTLIYVVAALLVRYVEHLIEFSREAGDIIVGNQMLMEKVVWPRFWAVQLWLLALFTVYCSLRELGRVMGREKVMKLFFENPGAI